MKKLFIALLAPFILLGCNGIGGIGSAGGGGAPARDATEDAGTIGSAGGEGASLGMLIYEGTRISENDDEYPSYNLPHCFLKNGEAHYGEAHYEDQYVIKVTDYTEDQLTLNGMEVLQGGDSIYDTWYKYYTMDGMEIKLNIVLTESSFALYQDFSSNCLSDIYMEQLKNELDVPIRFTKTDCNNFRGDFQYEGETCSIEVSVNQSYSSLTINSNMTRDERSCNLTNTMSGVNRQNCTTKNLLSGKIVDNIFKNETSSAGCKYF